MGQAAPQPAEQPATSIRRTADMAVLITAGLLWGAAIGVGMWHLLCYSNGAGAAAEPPSRWTADTRLTRLESKSTLIMFAHPRCPCTRASVVALARLMASEGDRLHAHVVFLRPAQFESGWERTGLWDSASSISGVSVHTDVDGLLARRFGAATSGQVVLYGRTGDLEFCGGITASRGHEGDCTGTAMIHRLLANQPVGDATTPVFGCALHDPEAAE